MALKPISVYLLEDTFVCQGCYLPEDTSYHKYAKERRPHGKNAKLELKQTRLRSQTRAKA